MPRNCFQDNLKLARLRQHRLNSLHEAAPRMMNGKGKRRGQEVEQGIGRRGEGEKGRPSTAHTRWGLHGYTLQPSRVQLQCMLLQLAPSSPFPAGVPSTQPPLIRSSAAHTPLSYPHTTSLVYPCLPDRDFAGAHCASNSSAS
jgi:hypothetical protein